MLDIVLISFSESAKIICQPSSINYINSPSIEARGSRNVLKAIDMSIKLVEEQKRSYLERGISYYRPYIVLITREHNNIDYELEEILGNIKEEVSSYNYQFICIVIKDVGKINLYEVNNQKFICSCNTNVKFSQLFKWLESECGVVETSEEINIVGETDWMDAFSIGDPANDADLDVDSAEDFAITAYYVSDGSTSFAGSELIVDEVENFARTRGGWNDECDSVEPNNSSDSDWCSDFRVDEIESLAYSISLPTPPHDANIVESDSSCNVDDWMDAFVIESVHNATKESNNSSYSYESFVPFSSLSDNTRLKKLKNEYEKTITYLTRQQNLLKSVQSQIDELKNKKNKIEIHLKNSPGMIGSAVGGFLSSLIGGFVGIAGALAGSTSTSSDEAKDKLLECDKELEAKMAQALMCKKQIEDFKQQKSNLEKKLSVLEEQNKYNEVYSSIFAPAEVKRKSHLQVQVYLHLYEESEKVKSLAKESDKNAERRDYIPLSLKLKKGDKVDVEFNVYGETRLASECKSII